ncbi:hypothetical protein SLEP1_g51187 [Rubroshorea leprosula]|uniref:Uncharacterized protein n=1 Tax=Rubroshorea leprosula TaxID=152421 RepID=A0AAV5M2G7_9ROSI|nr:hypothetical protein SLEP1_g51187 [Rubroshorea leprosula]
MSFSNNHFKPLPYADQIQISKSILSFITIETYSILILRALFSIYHSHLMHHRRVLHLTVLTGE